MPNIYSETSFVNAPAEPPSIELQTLLSQPFTFLDSGLECYAFLSQDKQIVLKVFKHHHIRQAQLIAKILPLANLEKLKREKEERLISTFASCKIAYEELKAETGLLYLHLSKTTKQLPVVTLIDKLGLKHKVALDEVQFMVQRRADLLMPSLERSLENGDAEAARKQISALMSLIVERCKKGIADRDPTLCKNFGFLKEHAIVIDVGSFSKNAFLKHPQIYKRELFYETLPLRCLLTKHFPELLPAFEEEFNKILENS